MRTSTIVDIFLVVCAKFYQCFASYDSMVSSSYMSLANAAMAVAYDENNNTILLIGGHAYRRQFMTFKDNTFTLINQYYLTTAQQTYGFGQHYTTLSDELWIIRYDGTGFITFNLNTYAVNTPSITLQTNVDMRGCLTSIAQYIIVLGGGGSTGTLDTVQMYDINEDVWLQNVPNMLQKRRSFACLVVNDNVYAIGGKNSSSIRLDTIEALDVSNIDSIQSNQWYMLQGILSQRISSNRAVQYNTDIIVIGGARNDEPAMDIHLIDTVTGSCDVIGVLEVPVSSGAPIIVGTTLYIFGGDDGSDRINTYQYISLPTSFPTQDPMTTPTESTMNAIPQTSEIATETATTIKAGDTSTSLLSTLETTEISTTTELVYIESSTKGTMLRVSTVDTTERTVTTGSLSPWPSYLMSNTRWTETTFDDESISDKERRPSAHGEDIALILAICIVAVLSTTIVLCLYRSSRTLNHKHNEPMRSLEEHHASQSVQRQATIDTYTTQVTDAVLSRTEATLCVSLGGDENYTDDIIQGNEIENDVDVNSSKRHDTLSMDSVANMRTIEGEPTECVDCGAIKPGKIYDELFYCDQCFSLYYGFKTKGNMNNVEMTSDGYNTGRGTTKGYFD